MPKYKVSLQGRTFMVTAPNKEALPEIVDTLSSQIGSKESQAPSQPAVPSPQEKPRFAAGSGAPLASGEIFPMKAVEAQIAQRGSISPQEIFEKFAADKGIGSKVMGTLQAVGAPFQAAEAAIANPLLAIQRGRPEEAFQEFTKGITGQKLGEVGDIMRSTGLFPEGISSGVGFVSTLVAPVQLINKGLKSLSGVSKGSDVKIIKAGQDLISGADEAVNTIGAKLEKAYQPVNDVLVDVSGIVDDIVELPSSVIKNLEKEIGSSLDDFLTNFTVNKARVLKSKLGELRPTSFGKDSRGLVERIDDKKLNKAYATIKDNMQKSLQRSGMPKEAKQLLDADEAFVDTLNASKAIKKAVIDSTTRKPTKAAKVARGLKTESEATTRVALNQLRKAGGSAKKKIDTAISNLEKFNRAQSISRAASGITRGVVVGGAAGAVGSKIINRSE